MRLRVFKRVYEVEVRGDLLSSGRLQKESWVFTRSAILIEESCSLNGSMGYYGRSQWR